jgi:hypothetical protein
MDKKEKKVLPFKKLMGFCFGNAGAAAAAAEQHLSVC